MNPPAELSERAYGFPAHRFRFDFPSLYLYLRCLD